MPEQEIAFLLDNAVLWEFAGVDRDNEPTVLTPYEIPVRWDDSQTKGIDQTGQLVRYDASIITDQNIPLGSIVWHGIIEDVADPPVDLFRVVYVQKTLDIRQVSTEYTYSLLRFRNTLPSIVGTG